MTGRKGSRSYHVCYCCGSDKTYIDPSGYEDKRALQIHHVNGGGYEERTKLGFRSDNFYMYYLNRPNDAKQKLQVLCVICNNKKS